MADTRVSREDDGGAVVWRKTYREGGRRRRIALLRWVARRLGANALLAPQDQTPEGACRTEQAMIHRLAALGAHVPTIVEAGERHLLLSDLGGTLAAACKATNDLQERRRLVALGLDALADLHARGGWLSQAFARNLTLRDDRVGFIDLEEDPATMMPIAAAQARDVLFYAHSTARFLVAMPGAHAELLVAHLQRESADVRREVAHTARRLAWLAPLARPFGARSRAVADALRSLRDAAG
jgi:tRNA A-37 threonylcarbamoyl transferase component Bud32